LTHTILALITLLWTSRQDTLPIRHSPQGNVLTLNIGRLSELAIDTQFKYIGGQRFILGNSADAEQHVFAATESNGALHSFYWIQIEELLPHREGGYNYNADPTLVHHGFELRLNRRTYTTAPEGNSDRARAFDILQRRGFSVPAGAARVRLVYLPEANARREVMVIYVRLPNVSDARSIEAAALSGLLLRSDSGKRDASRSLSR
jgi:hypothetical protein